MTDEIEMLRMPGPRDEATAAAVRGNAMSDKMNIADALQEIRDVLDVACLSSSHAHAGLECLRLEIDRLRECERERDALRQQAQRGHDADCEVRRGVGAYCTCEAAGEVLAGLRDTLDEVRHERDDAVDELGRARRECAETESLRVEARDDAAAFRAQRDEARADADRQRRLRAVVEQDREAHRTERDAARAEVARLTERIAEVEAGARDVLRECDDMTNDADRAYRVADRDTFDEGAALGRRDAAFEIAKSLCALLPGGGA